MRAPFLSLLVLCVIVGTSLASTVDVLQVHLAFGGGSDMVVSWGVPNTTDVASYVPAVMYGEDPSALSSTASAPTPEHEKCFTESPYFYHATLTPLKPSTRYFYKCGSASSGFSPVYNFTTKPANGADGAVSFVWYGDMGVTNSQDTINAVSKLVADDEIDLVLHVGDLSYADDRIIVPPSYGDAYEDILDQFYTMIMPISTRKAYMTTPGNHEWPCFFGEYQNRLLMPYKQSGSTSKMYYSFTYGRVHFTMMSTEDIQALTHIAPGSKAYTWLEGDLASAAADKASGNIDWIIVLAHRPLYCSYHWSACCWDACDNQVNSSAWNNKYRDNVEPLLLKYQVDAWLNGHTHNYERTLTIVDNQPNMRDGSTNSTYVNPTSPFYVTAGAAGDIEIQGHHFMQQPDWSITRISTVEDKDNSFNTGYSHVTAFNSSLLDVKFVRAHDGAILDHFQVVRT